MSYSQPSGAPLNSTQSLPKKKTTQSSEGAIVGVDNVGVKVGAKLASGAMLGADTDGFEDGLVNVGMIVG